MELFTALGINSTLFIQIGGFLVTFIFLKLVLFDPYFRAYLERSKQTFGQVGEAEKYNAESKELEAKYAREARKINEEYKMIYDKIRSEAMKTYEAKLAAAREEAKANIENSRKQISKAADSAKEEVKKELPQISALISSRLLGKELH